MSLHLTVSQGMRVEPLTVSQGIISSLTDLSEIDGEKKYHSSCSLSKITMFHVSSVGGANVPICCLPTAKNPQTEEEKEGLIQFVVKTMKSL